MNAQLQPGAYRVDIVDVNDYLLHSRSVELEAGPGEFLDLGTLQRTPLHQSILGQLPDYARHEYGVEFSESIGYMSDEDTGLWIALLGASRVLGPEQFSKLRNFPMATFDHVAPDHSALYVVAGFNEATQIEVQCGEALRIRRHLLLPASHPRRLQRPTD